MFKTHGCGELRAEHVGEQVELAGWVNRRRDHGGLTFVDLRDRSGVVQTVSNPELSKEVHAIAEQVRSEWVLHIVGEVRARPEGMQNTSLPTGEVEVEIKELEVLNPAKTPPFTISEESEVDEMVRLKYRYLDLRRERLQRNLELRHNVIQFIRDELGARGFWEIETPILFKATPEGARDYLVPSRLYPGEAYALPQSPQQLKQLLMVAGTERYFQIARCFRDEDQRGDRQPEFTQLDIEMSFAEREDVMQLLEGVYSSLVEQLFPERPVFAKPWPRLTYQESMDRFGTDRPDLRFGLEIKDISDLAEGSGFKVFEGAVDGGGEVRGINCEGCGHFSRREIDELTDMIKPFGAQGLAYLAPQESGEPRSSFAKFLPSDRSDAIIKRMEANPGDLLLFVAGQREIVRESLSRLRAHLGARLELYGSDMLAFCWVVDFPLVQWDPDAERWDPSHHLFTAPMPEDLPLLDSDPGRVRGQQYDVVLNGEETAGGSIRIHDRGMQEKIFELIGLDLETARHRFGHMLTAFEYGTPPHGGVASGLDRLCMILAKEPNIREVIAFPKNQAARDVMAEAPSTIDPKQLEELHIRIVD
ncbi:MAG: aspartate--tRNA ligase [Anaerolineae bacterium]|nr:MAG: aspartate--tRNA ligase [Anaerolineae bacterium]